MSISGRLYNLIVLLITATPSYFFAFTLLAGYAPYYAYALWGSLSGLAFFLTRQVLGGKVHLSFGVRTTYIVIILAALSIYAAFATAESRSAYQYYVLWSALPQAAYLQFLLAVLAVDFLPGFMLLYLVGGTRKFGLVGTILFSFIISYFVSILVALYLVKFQDGLSSSYAYVSGVDIPLAVAAVIYSVLYDRSRTEAKIDDAGIAFGFLMAGFGFLYAAVDYAGDIPFLKGDLFTLWGSAMRYLQPGWQTATNLNYPQGFYWNLAMLVNQASIPSMNAAVLTIPLVILVPMAIAFTAKSVSGDKTLALFAAAGLALFGPLLWTVAFDVNGVYSGADPMTSIPFYTWDFKDTTVGVICTIPLVGLLFGLRDVSWARKGLPLVAALATAILAHVIEPIIFVGAFLPIWMLTPFSTFREKVYASLAVLVALGVTVGVGESVGMSSALLAGEILGLATAGLLGIAVLLKFGPVNKRVVVPLAPAMRWMYSKTVPLVLVLLYLYGLSVLAFASFPSINMQTAVWSYGSLPLGLWWLVLGILAPIAAVAYFLGAFDGAKTWVPALVGGLLLSVLVIETLSFLNTSDLLQLNTSLPTTGVPTGILSWRLLVILLVPMTLLFGLGVSKIAGMLAEREAGKYILPVFIIGLIILGIPSTVLEARTFIGNQAVIQPTGFKLTSAELNASSFMVQQLPLNSVVLSLTARSSQIITASERNVRALANLSATSLGTVMTGSHDPLLGITLLREYHVGYVFLDQFDYGALAGSAVFSNGTGYLVKQLLPYLPVVFSQQGNLIYSVPYLNPATSSVGVGLFSPFNQTKDYYTQATLLSLATAYSGVAYGQIPDGEKLVVLPYDPQPSLGPQDSGAFASETAGDNLTLHSSDIQWSMNLTNTAPHTLEVTLSSNHAVPQVTSLSIQMFRSGIPLSCLVNSTATSHAFIGDLTPNNGTIYIKVPSMGNETLPGLLLSCFGSEGKTGAASVSIESITFTVPEDLLAEKFVTAYPQQTDLSNYLSWVQGGGVLLVADPGLPLGYFGHYLGLQAGASENITSLPLVNGSALAVNATKAAAVRAGGASVLSWYGNVTSSQAAPFLVSEEIGNGTIFWAQLGPLLSLMEGGNLTLAQAYAVYSGITDLLPVRLQPVSGPNFDAITAGTDTLQGPSTTSGSYVIPYLNGVKFSIIVSSTRQLGNFTVDNLFGTGAVWTASSKYATMGTSPAPGMVNMTYPNGGNLTVGPGPDGLVTLSGSLGGTETNFTLSSPLTLTTTKSFTMLVASPRVTLHGTFQTNRVYVSADFLKMINVPPYGGTIFQSGGPFQAKGNMNFSMTSFKDVVMIDNISGSWQPVDTNPPTLWTITNAGWVTLFVSQGDALLVIGVAFMVHSKPSLIRRAKKGIDSVPEGA